MVRDERIILIINLGEKEEKDRIMDNINDTINKFEGDSHSWASRIRDLSHQLQPNGKRIPETIICSQMRKAMKNWISVHRQERTSRAHTWETWLNGDTWTQSLSAKINLKFIIDQGVQFKRRTWDENNAWDSIISSTAQEQRRGTMEQPRPIRRTVILQVQ